MKGYIRKEREGRVLKLPEVEVGSSGKFSVEAQTKHRYVGEWRDMQAQRQFPGISKGCRVGATAPCGVAANQGSFVH